MDNTSTTQKDTDQESTAMMVDPVITWLEQVVNFMGSTPDSREMARRALNRLRPPAIDVNAVITGLLEEFGTWRAGNGAIVSDRPNRPGADADDAGYYGGFLVAESIDRRPAVAASFLPELIAAARENPAGRAVLARMASELSITPPAQTPVRDRLDGTMRLARLSSEFKYARELACYSVGVLLEHLAAGLLSQTIDAAKEDIEAFLDRKREARRR